MEFVQTGCPGLARGKPADPCTFVIFGASGDLTRRELIPALYALLRDDLLPRPFGICGFARNDWSDEQFRDAMREAVGRSFEIDERTWSELARHMHYVRGEFEAPPEGDYARLTDRLSAVRKRNDLPGNFVFHLAAPPRYYGDIAERLAAASLLRSGDGWRRLVIEKPFGRDESSARDLDRRLLELIDEDRLYRVDHFLGKETVQNMLVFRFANPGFEPIWNRDAIDSVHITVAEDGGVRDRAGYYDRAGVVRDMLQNHLLQLLCLTAVEPPVCYSADAIRNEQVKVLEALRPIVPGDCILGQYRRGMVDGREARGYREEKGVEDDSATPTFVAARVEIDNWRWSGVPFYLRTGKRMARKNSEIHVVFRPTPHVMFPARENEFVRKPNVLTFRLQPDEGIDRTFLAKQPGPEICLTPVTMRFRYHRAFGIERSPSAYEWLLLDVVRGDQTLFPRSDWIYRAWSAVDGLLDGGESAPRLQPETYEAGSWGPPSADDIPARDGRSWIDIESVQNGRQRA